MATIKMLYLVSDKDANGNVRYYFRRPKQKKIRLPGEPGTEAFALAYWAARRGETPAVTKPARAREGTFRWIADYYLKSVEFRSLDYKHTGRPRELLLEELVKIVGEKPAVIDPKAIKDGMKRRKHEHGYGAAKLFLTTLRHVYKVAIDGDFVSSDPTHGIRLEKPETDGHRTWTLEDCAAYEKKWPIGTQARTAYAIGIFTAQRISDAVKMGRPHEGNGRIRLVQQKNGKRKPVEIDIPIVAPLRAALDGWQGKGLTYLENQQGRPYKSPEVLRQWFRYWCDEAGTHPDCTFHGLRKAAATRMADAGCTPHQIMAVLGHKTHQQAATYTAKAHRAGLADDALGSLYGERSVPVRKSRGKIAHKTDAKTGAA